MTQHIHFIAIGGAAMHNLAIALKKNGYTISGSDDQIFDPARSKLDSYGLLPEKEGWFPEKIHAGIHSVILGMHAKADNPELLRAKELGIQVYSFPEYIYEHSRNKTRIVVGGSHGKTTITAMLVHVLNACGVHPDYLAGAAIPGCEDSVRLTSDSNYIVIEGDEYLTSPLDLRPKFHIYKPHIAVLSGIAYDHINVFKTWEDYVEQFRIFINLIEPKGSLIYFTHDNTLRELVAETRPDIRCIAYDVEEGKIKDGTTVILHNTSETPIRVFGEHNLANISAAREVCLSIGINEDDFYRHISTFSGAKNRLTLLYEDKKRLVFRDFAHSPSKVKATVEAVRKQYPQKKLIACLELHTFSSLNTDFLPYYAGTMNNCDTPLLYYNPHTLELKKLTLPEDSVIRKEFGNNLLKIYTDSVKLKNDILRFINTEDSVLLMMSSGNFDNMDMNSFF